MSNSNNPSFFLVFPVSCKSGLLQRLEEDGPRSVLSSFCKDIDLPSLVPVHTTQEEFKTDVSLWKRIKCFRSSEQWPVILDLCFVGNSGREITWYRDDIVFEKFRFQNVFRPHENEKPSFSNSYGLKRVFEEYRFYEELVWTVGHPIKIKLLFHISPSSKGINWRNGDFLFFLAAFYSYFRQPCDHWKLSSVLVVKANVAQV